MAFVELPRLPDDIRHGMSGGPGYNTEEVSVASGYAKYNQVWENALREWNIGYVRTEAQLRALLSFFHVHAKGKAHHFRVKDWSDYRVTLADAAVGLGIVGTGLGDGTPGPMQLYKRYTSGAQTADRKIQKPTASPAAAVYKNGALQTASTHYTLDTTTGLVTWLALDSEAITGHTVGASHQFTTAEDLPGLVIGEKVYLSGISGTAATALNAKAHTISNKTGSGPYTWTVSTATTGLTASGGTAYEYPQAADALAWAGEFDVPAGFGEDRLRFQMLESTPGNRLWEFPSLTIREVRIKP